MTAKSAEEIQGSEHDWLASDEDMTRRAVQHGRVPAAAFLAELPAEPAAMRRHDSEIVEAVIEGATSPPQLHPAQHVRPNSHTFLPPTIPNLRPRVDTCVAIQNHCERRERIMRYWILDKDETPQRFPLQRLLRRVRDLVGPGLRSFELTRARGYGLQVREWEEALEGADRIVVPFELLDGLSAGTEEWFYDLEAHVPGAGVRFGLHDSTALFVEAPPEIAEALAGAFGDVRPGE